MQHWSNMGQTSLTTGGLDPRQLRKKCPYLEFFWCVFSRIRTEYVQIVRIQYERRKMRTRKIQYIDAFHAVAVTLMLSICCKSKYFFKMTEHCRK